MTLNVLHLIDSAAFYGAEAVLMNLMVEQRKCEIKPILGSIGKHGISVKDIETVAEQNSITVRKFRMSNGPNLLGAMSIIRFARKHHVHLIHCHGYKANILMGILPAGYRKIPYLVTLHGWTSMKRFSKLSIYCWADALFAKRANMVVAVSEAMLSHPKVLAMKLNPVVVHNGIPEMVSKQTKKILPDKLVNYDNKKCFTVGAIGRLSALKGFDFLISAVANVVKSGREVRLVIIGGGGIIEHRQLENIAKARGISDKVFLAGYVDNGSSYLRCFDVFVISSLTEGLPIVLLEALQAGIPIVATRVGGIPEVLDNGKYGILVEPGDEHDLANAISKIYDYPEVEEQLSVVAKERAKRKFSAEHMERGYNEVYEKLLHA